MIKVIKSGFYTTIQDQGRFGYRAFGVPVSGVMDSYSSQFANSILGNDANTAVLELTMTGPTLEFQKPTQIALSGANMNPMLNGTSIKMNTIIQIKTNDILSFGKLENGFRAYLAVKGGFLSETMLNSRSMYKGITKNAQVNKGYNYDYQLFNNDINIRNAKIKYDNSMIHIDIIEVTKGPEFDKLSLHEQKELLKRNFIVSKLNNRMAYQLEPLFKNSLEPILTSAVLPGTIQLTPSGQLIVLMRDCQTTGGYPRILQLTENAINTLSQQYTGKILKIRLKD
jgi:biotin-dependent carboxylase-like uncharacterized protein